MKTKPKQIAFNPDIEEAEAERDDELQRLKNVFQRYRDAKCPIKKVHPQSVTSLAKSQHDRMMQVLDKYGDDRTIEGMERFCNEQFWIEKGLPLNAFYKFQDRWCEDSGTEEPQDSSGSGRGNQSVREPEDESIDRIYFCQRSDEVIRKRKILSKIDLAVASAVRRRDEDSVSAFLRMVEEIKPRDAEESALNEAERVVEEYLNVLE